MKRVITIVAVTTGMALGVAAPAFAQGISDSFGSRLDDVLVGDKGYQGVENPATALPAYIGFLIGWTAVVGIVMLVHLIVAAYEYMTAAGDTEKVANAKKRIRNAIVAALLLAAGYIIATLVAYAWGSVTGYQTGISP